MVQTMLWKNNIFRDLSFVHCNPYQHTLVHIWYSDRRHNPSSNGMAEHGSDMPS